MRLYFLGMRHPKPDIVESAVAAQARHLADTLGLTGTHVFFNEGWVAYDDRQNYLMEADVGVSLHLEHLETAYSFRTRILDYLWAGLPIVASAGDGFAEIISAEGIGTVVPVEDVDAVAEALVGLLGDRRARARNVERTPRPWRPGSGGRWCSSRWSPSAPSPAGRPTVPDWRCADQAPRRPQPTPSARGSWPWCAAGPRGAAVSPGRGAGRGRRSGPVPRRVLRRVLARP